MKSCKMSSAFVLQSFRLHGASIGRHFCRRYAKKYTKVDFRNNKYTQVYRDLHGSIGDETIAKDFVYALNKKERALLLSELQSFESKAKESVLKEGEPPTVLDLTGQQKRILFFHNALPFLVFGFMDNFIMIVCGEYLEFQFGTLFGFSTMAAAGMGNLVSDVIGLGSGNYITGILHKFGFKAPTLTPEQVDLPKTKRISNWGKTIGIAVGCALGMVPLLVHVSKP